MGLNQTYKLLHSKRNHKQNEKTTHRMGENICKQGTDKGLLSKIYKKLMELRLQKQTTHTTQQQKKQPHQKMGRRPKQTFLQKRHTDGQ